MSATCTFCGGNLAPGVLHDPKQCAPERGLDFEKAKLEAVLEYYGDGKPLSWDTDKYEAALNAQVAERIAAARQEAEAPLKAKLAEQDAILAHYRAIFVTLCESFNAEIASLRASHQEVIRVVREWQVTLNKDERSLEHTIAKGKLAALDLGGAE